MDRLRLVQAYSWQKHDRLNEQNFEEYQKILDKSIRSFVRSWKIRNKLGDRTNLVWVPRERDWDILAKKTEAHLLMGRIEND